MPSAPPIAAPDAASLLFAAEEAVCDRIVFASDIAPARSRETNAFGKPIHVDAGAGASAVAKAIEHAEAGERVAVVAGTGALLGSPTALANARERGIPLVVHAMADALEASALLDLGWGVLTAAGAADSLDLSLVARRAAEDSRTPFFVVHDRKRLDVIEAATISVDAISAFVGAPSFERGAPNGKGAHEFAERVPFALASAFRDYENATLRGRDALVASSSAHAPVAFVGAGASTLVVEREAHRLRARGENVATVKLAALRPFPGPRLVKALLRAHLVVVVEAVSTPLAQSTPLAREIKAAFADALTWAPGYPGIGKIPHIVVLHAEGTGPDAAAVDALLASARGHAHGHASR